MIPSVSSYDDEVFNSAFANISLIADRVWTFDKRDHYQTLNRSLWIQNCKLIAKHTDNGKWQGRHVRDVIPQSLLARYGNYEYDEERESLYRRVEEKAGCGVSVFRSADATEPWMLAEVEGHFARLTSPPSARKVSERNSALRESAVHLGVKSHWTNVSNYGHPSQQPLMNEGQEHGNCKKTISIRQETESETDEFSHYNPRLFSIENPEELQLQLRIYNDHVRDIWRSASKMQQPQVLGTSRADYHRQDHQKHHARLLQQQNPSQSNQNWTKYSINVSTAQDRQQQFYCAVQCQPWILRAEYHQSSHTETYEILRKPLPPALSAEVPEFFPKVPAAFYLNGQKERKSQPLQYFPSSCDRSYQNELFPYMRTAHEAPAAIFQNPGIPVIPASDGSNYVQPAQQWLQRVGPITTQIVSSVSQPVCNAVQPLRATAVAQPPLQIYDKFLSPGQSAATSIPVYQRPVELYQDTAQRRKTQGVDFNNLILLTKSAFKSRRSHSKNRQQQGYESRKHQNVRAESDASQSHGKGHAKRSRDLLTVNTLVSELRSFEDKCGHGKGGPAWKAANSSSARRAGDVGKAEEAKESPVTMKSECDSESDRRRSKKRLYRDVLTNSSSNRIALDSVIDKRYEELELQAMEQYRTSEESLALKYQELEKQALEQYKTSGSAQTSSTSLLKQTRESQFASEDRSCKDGQKCSGFGRCSPSEQLQEKSEKGSFPSAQITLLRAENRAATNEQSQTGSRKAERPVIVSKSVTELAREIFQGSKNISKGASGDRIDRSGRTSTKRRLILVSPFKRESEAKLMKSANSEETCSPARILRRAAASHRRCSEILQIGGGDENIKNLPSSRAEVWFSGFWTS